MDSYALAAMVALFAFELISPGPNTFLVLQTRVEDGAAATDAVIAGVCTGAMLWAVGPIFGLLALLEHAPRAAPIMQLCGAAWFFVVGWKALAHRDAPAVAPTPSRGGGFAGGLASSVLNPATALLFTAAMPALLADSALTAVHAVSIALLYGGLAALWYCSISTMAGRSRRATLDGRLSAGLGRVSAVALMGFGFLFVMTV